VRDRRQFNHFVAVISFVFYLCYLTYIVLPVMGPRIYFGEQADLLFGEKQEQTPIPADLAPEDPPLFPETVREGFFYGVVIWVYRHFEAPGAAFPSSHVAVSLATLYFTWIYVRRLRWVHTVLAAGLCVSTVYCRYHYVVDVFAGMAVTLMLVPLGTWLYRKFDRVEDGPGTAV
jgi:membrane-associated phospholipid phosphatase